MDFSCSDGRPLYIEMLTGFERSPYVMHEIQGIMTLGVEDYYFDEVGIDHVR